MMFRDQRIVSSFGEQTNLLESLVGVELRVCISYENYAGRRKDEIYPLGTLSKLSNSPSIENSSSMEISPENEFYFLYSNKHQIDLNPRNLRGVSYILTRKGRYLPVLTFESFGINRRVS